MEESFLLMLSNLLNLHNNLDPTPTSSTSSPPFLLTSTSATPLLFFTIASILSFISPSPSPKKPKKPKPDPDQSISAFKALSTERIWAMDPPLRDAQWRAQYGLSYPVFTTIVEKLKPFIAQSNLSLPSDYAVAMVLSRLSHGLSAKALAARYGLEPYLISKITNMITRILATKVYPELIKIPVIRRRVSETTSGFQELTRMGSMCGAIDGTAIRVGKLGEGVINPSMYYCRFGFASVLLQVVADHKKLFWDVCVKAPGGYDDATHFRDSLLYNRLILGDIVWDKGVNVRGEYVRPYIVGDSGYPLLSFLLTPFSQNRTGSPAQNAFDEALMRGRKAVEDAIGLLKGRWRILQELNVGLNHAPQTVVACCVLHNLCQIAREPEPEPEPWKEPEENAHPPRVLENEKSSNYAGEDSRQALADDLYQRLSSR